MGGKLSSLRLPEVSMDLPAADYTPPASPNPKPRERLSVPESKPSPTSRPARTPPQLPPAVAVPPSVLDVPKIEPVKPSQSALEELLAALLGENAVCDNKVLQLLEGSNPNLTLDKSGLKPIHVAIIQRNLPLLQKVLSNRDTDVNVRHAGLTPLHFAAQVVTLDVVQELLKQPKVQVDALTTQEKQTALMVVIATDAVMCTEEEKAEVVRCLVDDPRCEITKEDGDGWIALTFAARHGNIPVGKLLLRDQLPTSYTINQLVNAYRQALLGGHETFCDLIMSSLTLTQKEHIRNMVAQLKELSGTTPFLRELLQHADAILDSGYIEPQQSSGPAWDRHDQLLEPGSVVRLLKDKGVVRALQRNVGKHLDGLDNVVGQCGLIKTIDHEGVINVDFGYFGSPHKKIRSINPKAVDRLSQDDYHGVDANGIAIHAGDTIRFIEDPVALENLTYTAMATDITSHIGQAGVLKYFNQACLPVVIVAGLPWTVDSLALKKALTVVGGDERPVQIGDVVEITSNKAVVERLQTPMYGGWKDALVLVLGKIGVVTNITCECYLTNEAPDCAITVKTDKTEVILNPKTVTVKAAQDKTLTNIPAPSPVARPRRPAPEIPVPPVAKEATKSSDKENNGTPQGSMEKPGMSYSKSEGDLIDLETRKDVATTLSQTADGTMLFLKREESFGFEEKESSSKQTFSATVNRRGKDAPMRKSPRYIPYEEIQFAEKIGKGGFGTVYKARWQGDVCAVKVIKCDDSEEGAESQIEVLQEAECHGSVSHPHIVQFFGFSFNDADQLNLNAYLVLKFVDGYNLHQCVFGYKLRLTAKEKHKIALQISEAIRYLHDDAKIIHQDIKPHNILIDKKTRESMVTDFGISKVFSDPPLDVTMAMYTQHACGSLPYMAPELVIISKRTSMYRKATELSDIWSLAATLTEMFTGKSFYDLSATPDLHTLMNLKASCDLPDTILSASVPIRAVLEASLRVRPEERPQSCRTLLRLLEEYGEDLQNLTAASDSDA